jgi:outer membrane protein
VGLIPITGVHESQARYDQARANEIAAQSALDHALEALREITAREEQRGALAAVAQELPLKMPVPPKIDDWAQFALQQNPAVIAAQDAAEAARKEIEIKRSGHYPTVQLVGSHTITRTDSPVGSDTDVSSIGVQLAIPLYAGGGIVSRTREAQFNFEAAQDRLEQSRRSVEREVRDAYRGVESNISQVEALKATTVSAASALEATQAGYDVGTRTIVDVLNAESDLFRAKRQYLKARYDYIVNGIALKQAAGTLAAEDLQAVNALLVQDKK